MKISALVLILVNVILFFSCHINEECSDNQLFILEQQNTSPRIKIEKQDSRDDVITKFQNFFGEDLCFKEIEFGLQLSEKVVRCHFNLYCPLKTSRFPKPSEVQILINSDKEVLINNIITIKIDSLGEWIKNNFDLESSDEMYKKEIAIIWNSLTPIEFMELTIIEIIEELAVKYDELSKQKYDKLFCKLNSEQVAKLRKDNPMKIMLDIGIPPPPPPPPINLNN